MDACLSKSVGQMLDKKKKDTQELKRNILHLILQYLTDHSFQNTAEALQSEAQIGTQYQVCENVDLEIILQEYQSYYFTKFERYPKILRKLPENEAATKKIEKKKPTSKTKLKKSLSTEEERNDFQFHVTSISEKEQSLETRIKIEEKQLCNFENYSVEWREMADQILKDTVSGNIGVSFKDCIGLEEPIERLKEALVYPLKYAELFKGIEGWKGVLLFGPPGTGKTLLAKALACETKTTFFNLTSSTFISKWRGESEKMIKTLFDVAKFYSPSTIFIDELDALVSTNSDSNHEASCRFKSELLTQIDGITTSDTQIFILAATNHPSRLSKALLRRFEKRILINTPDEETRIHLFNHYLKKQQIELDMKELRSLSQLCEYFSGADIKTVCKEVAISNIRLIIKDFERGNKKSISGGKKVNFTDVQLACKRYKPCSNENDFSSYLNWSSKYGSV